MTKTAKEQISPEEKQRLRLDEAHMKYTEEQFAEYLAKPDVILTAQPKTYICNIPGYKRCGKCGDVKKFYLFNRNKAAKDGCTGTCAICQRQAASKSYKKTKQKRNYAEYYRKNAEAKKAAAKKYYQENKDKCDEQHRKYLQTKAGQKVMKKAKAKRNNLLNVNAGIPYTRELVIDRDKMGGQYPVCYLCGKEITEAKDIHLDHVIGVTIGGANCFTNIACVHSQCNLRKTKDCTEVTPQMVELIQKRAEAYIDEHPDDFDM